MKRIVAIVALLAACSAERPVSTLAPAGDPENGRALIQKYACLACHAIPGFDAPQGTLAPSLAGMASRSTISGRVPNDPATMAAFLQNPPAVDRGNQMPPLGISEEEARHISAYLFTLK